MISSERLDLIPLTPDFLRASLENDLGTAGQILGVPVPADWLEIQDAMTMRLQQLEEDPALQPWLLRAMVFRNLRCMVGHIGFHTAPGADYLEPYSPGAVEFGFEVFSAFRRQGFAREASVALMQWARQTHGIQKFVVTIAPGNVASQTLAQQLGFVRIGSHIDEVDGLEDILELRTGEPLNGEASCHARHTA